MPARIKLEPNSMGSMNNASSTIPGHDFGGLYLHSLGIVKSTIDRGSF